MRIKKDGSIEIPPIQSEKQFQWEAQNLCRRLTKMTDRVWITYGKAHVKIVGFKRDEHNVGRYWRPLTRKTNDHHIEWDLTKTLFISRDEIDMLVMKDKLSIK